MSLLTGLDIGCGKVPKNPFKCDNIFGLDIDHNLSTDTIKIVDLAIDKIPFEDDFFDVVTAYDFIEHVPRIIYAPLRRNPFIELMNEISRVLKPGGIFFSSTPAYPHPAVFRDPTHVNIITERTFINYFSIAHKCYANMYGYHGNLIFLRQYRKNQSHLVVTMRKKVSNSKASKFADDTYLNKFSDIIG